jgi:release factor glutamine methyltransferase
MTHNIPDKSEEALQVLKKALGKNLEHEALWLIESAAGKNYSWGYALDSSERLILSKYLEKRLSGEPLQLIIGNYPFRGINLVMRRGVFIPRLETELIVDLLPDSGSLPNSIIVDACTGTGAIGLSVKKERPEIEVILTEKDSFALNLARENTLLNKVSASIIRMDLLSGFRDESIGSILCNPPYIKASDYDSLGTEVKDYDPVSALLAGTDGLDAIRSLISQARKILMKNGFLCFEHGFDQQDACISLLEREGFMDIVQHKDLSCLPRFLSARRA